MIGKIFISFWILPWLALLGNPAEAQKWSGVLDESLDERHDVEIFRAVVESMRQWENHKKNSHRTKREASRVCYEEVGCFEATGPFSYLEMLPSHPKEVGTRFLMYGSRKARSIPMEVPADNINDKANNAIDPDLPTKVIVHGFGSGCDHIWVYEMRSALMAVHDCNIICVDWSLGSAIPNYVRAAANTRLVGRQLAKLVRSLNVPLEKVHLIGFSLGAHVAGFAGAELANVSRITGLDPAGPLFESQDPRARLDETDATFVDVIHSNGEQLILGGLGSWQPMGDVDFYPNGGRMQTGCSNLFLGAVSDFIWSGSVEGRSLCNHRRAYKLFTDSVSPKCRFPAFPCDTGYDGLLKGDCFPCGVNGSDRPCGDMGYYSDASSARGQLYLVTREEEPFCAHQYQVKVYNSRGERPARSYGKLQVTLVGESNFNETFTMTRKDDEELLVGALLHKIVVPHPAVSNLEAIEITYTAYSGWISSGLVTWSVDKIAVIDSFGKILSVCMKGLILESSKPVYLPLYPGECNVPLELENSTTTVSTVMKFAAMKVEPTERSNEQKPVGGIGPFTKEQNYERIETFALSPEDNIEENPRPQISLGPFTKEQNYDIKITKNQAASTKKQNVELQPQEESIQMSFVSKDAVENLSSSETKTSISSPWSYVDVSEAGSNSLENNEAETGRGFSGSSFVSTSTSEPSAKSTDATTVNFQSEVSEPVLQTVKKETGRSMRLPEITEPILRPRSTRQNLKNEGIVREALNDDLEESSSSPSSQEASRAFTVQFLPERLAGILAQAERYARQTLLPLISQYTPSFVGSARQERVKYFPPLTDLDDNGSGTILDGYVVNSVSTTGNTERSNEVDTNERQHSGDLRMMGDDLKKNSSGIRRDTESLEITTASSYLPNKSLVTSGEVEIIESREFSGQREGKSHSDSAMIASGSQQNDWIPMEATSVYANKEAETSRSVRNSSRSLNYDKYDNKWMSEDGGVWKPAVEDAEAGPDTKIDDWVPIVDTRRNSSVSDVETTTNDSKRNSVEAAASITTKSPWNLMSTSLKSIVISSTEGTRIGSTTEKSTEDLAHSTTAGPTKERKFIPFIDFENRDTFLAPNRATEAPSVLESSSMTSNMQKPSHIQKIPSPIESRGATDNSDKRGMIFPYAYERKKDPRTRYIPLIPEEEMGKQKSLTERDR